MRKIPPWFAEGLADMIADTGHERISRDEVLETLLSGHHFTPDSTGQLPRPRAPQEYGVLWPLFHGQSRLFIEYLRLQNEDSFNRFLSAVIDGESLAYAFEENLGGSVSEKWTEFLNSLS